MSSVLLSPPRRLQRFLWVAILLASAGVEAQSISGLWSPDNAGHAAWITSDWNDFSAKWGQFNRDGMRIYDFEVYLQGSIPVYVGLFRQETGGEGAWFTSDWNDFAAHWSQAEKDGWRMHDFESYEVNGVRWYAGIFREGTGGYATAILSDWTQFGSAWAAYEEAGLRMHDFEAYEDHGVVWYVGIFLPGTGASGAWFTADWNDLMRQAAEFERGGLRMTDYEEWQEGGTWFYGGIFRPGTGGNYGWFGADWESFDSFWHDREKEGYLLHDIELSPAACNDACMNLLVLPAPDYYDYAITAGPWHCEGEPGTCSPFGGNVLYHAPFYEDGTQRLVRLSAVLDIDPIFTLPFYEKGMHHNGWLYSTKPDEPKQWHHAVDYYNGSTFNVIAAAPGTVLHVGWDRWSGNTVVVSHDVGSDKDRYRTIYMHMRNGARNDCQMSWAESATLLSGSSDPDLQKAYPNYVGYLDDTSCSSDGSGTPKADWWGSEADTIRVKAGDHVDRGEILGKSGATGPGGCGCTGGGDGPNTHLHIFFARRDPTDDRWYFIDPYGIYGTPDCYPTRGNADGAAWSTACARYPIAWVGGHAQIPNPPVPRLVFTDGDANDDGKIDISDAINLLGCMFLGGECPHCEDSADVNDDGNVDMSDAIFTLTCLFQRQCLDLGGVTCESEPSRLGCREYRSCPVTRPPR